MVMPLMPMRRNHPKHRRRTRHQRRRQQGHGGQNQDGSRHNSPEPHTARLSEPNVHRLWPRPEAASTPQGLQSLSLWRPLRNPGASVRCQSDQGARRSSPLQGDLCITQGTGVRCQSPQRGAPLHPLQGERRMLASSPAEGEGSSGRAPTPSNQRGRTPDAGPAVLPLSKGRGRRRRTRRQSVRGLPRTQARVTQSSLWGRIPPGSPPHIRKGQPP